jgi:signal peptidase I
MPHATPRRSALRRIRLGVIAVLVAFATQVVVAGPYLVQYNSMSPTLEDGELMLVDRVTPRIVGYSRGDVVVFQPPEGPNLFVKRIVGLPGEEVIVGRGGVFVNGRLVSEPYLCGVPASSPQAMRIPEDTYLVLGDNRTESLDSRAFGPVPTDLIVGRVWASYRADGDLALFSGGAAALGDRSCSP